VAGDDEILSVFITGAPTRPRGREMIAASDALRSAAMSTPRCSSPAQMSARMVGACSRDRSLEPIGVRIQSSLRDR
jgi:hypothetical protein